MEFYKRIIEIVDANLIYCLVPIILTLMVIERIFKNRFETKNVLNFVRWTIICYAVITWATTLTGVALYPEESVFINRATGPYKAPYWTMLFSTLILPFTLVSKKLASKFWYVLFVAFCIKIGIYFERFVIITTSYHRDYQTENGNTEYIDAFLFSIGMILLQGIIITILTLGIFEIIKRNKTAYNSVYKQ